MQKIKWIGFLMACMVLCGACTSKNQYTIKGTVIGEGLEGKDVSLMEIRGLSQPHVIQQTTVKEGSFTFKGNVPYPDIHLVYVNQQGPIPLFLDNEDITMNIPMDSLLNVKISGSLTHAEFQEAMASLDPYNALMDDINNSSFVHEAAIDSLEKPDTKMSDEEWTVQKDSMKDAVNDSLAIALREAALNGKYHIYNWIKEHNQSYVAAYLAYELLQSSGKNDEIATILEVLDKEKLAQSQWITLLNTHYRYMTRTVEGATYTDMTIPEHSGKDITLSDYVGKKPFVILYFWASWNPTSRQYQKELIPLYEKFKDRGLEIISISLDREQEDWDLALEADSIPWIQVSELKFWQSASVENYNITEIPQVFVINNEGSILQRTKSPRELDKLFDRILPDPAIVKDSLATDSTSLKK